MVEYAWRQPDGEIAPILQTDGYELMVRSGGGDWMPVGGTPAPVYAYVRDIGQDTETVIRPEDITIVRQA